MASVGERHRDSDATAYDGNDMNNMSAVNQRRVLENPLVTPEKGQAKRKDDEEAQVVVNEKESVSDSSIKVYAACEQSAVSSFPADIDFTQIANNYHGFKLQG